MSGSIKVGGNTIATHTGAQGAGEVTLTADTAVIEGSSSGDLVRITQTGTGNALVVEDETNPDSTPFVVNSSGRVGIGTSSPQTTLDLNGQVHVNRPSDHWAGTGTYISVEERGGLSSEGSYGISLTSNGYRNSSGTWTSLSANSNNLTGASQISLLPTGIITFNTDSNKTDGSSTVPTEKIRIDSNGFLSLLGTGSILKKTITIADDAAGTIVLPNQSWAGGICIVSVKNRDNYPTNQGVSIFWFDAGLSLGTQSIATLSALFTTGTLTGTTGTDGVTTYSVINSPSRAIMIENREGLGTLEYSYLILQ